MLVCRRGATSISVSTMDGANSLEMKMATACVGQMASRHSRESGNPGAERHGDWMPACAGMTFYWHRTYEMDI